MEIEREINSRDIPEGEETLREVEEVLSGIDIGVLKKMFMQGDSIKSEVWRMMRHGQWDSGKRSGEEITKACEMLEQITTNEYEDRVREGELVKLVFRTARNGDYRYVTMPDGTEYHRTYQESTIPPKINEALDAPYLPGGAPRIKKSTYGSSGPDRIPQHFESDFGGSWDVYVSPELIKTE